MLLILCSKRFDFEDSRWKQLYRNGALIFSSLPGIDQSIVGLRFRLFKAISSSKNYRDLQKARKFLYNIAKQWVIEKCARRSFGSKEINDYLDAFLVECEQEKHKSFNREQLIAYLIQFIAAGTDTSANTMYFACYMLAKYPKIQEKVQKELDDVVGCETLPSLEHRQRLIYTEAFLREVDRYYALAPITPVRINSDEVTIRGFKIPKGKNFLANTFKCLRDSKYFKNPEQFDVYNFIDERGELINVKSFMPFGIGKRRCPGELLAKIEIFLFISAIIQNFSLSLSSDENNERGETKGIIKTLHPYKVIVKRREALHTLRPN
ncbi:hypothetical protein B4U79_01846 [Dinothrombium tinctorium]|uniref:Uncharacterized protein n=1 Tax=Dinothrombium tinctorium TaxID=1965070 RepID=A0A3S3PJA9_9ACAR|nr:hypothetical protein B4U79_01846 [Dinothrombium tinctorium]